MPEGNEYHANVPDYYLPPKEDVYNNMESLIYHFKIVMGEVPVPVVKFTILLRRKWRARFLFSRWK
jgi:NADH-quinone oxidoreductase subunit D